MKKVILINFLVFSFGVASDFSFLIRGGYVNANVLGDVNSLNVSPLNSYKLGIGIEVGFIKTFSIQPEINFIAKGYNSSVTADALINYIEVPIWLKYRILGFFIGAGPYFGFTIGDITSPGSITNLQNFDFGLGAIIGFEFNVSKNIMLFLDVQYLQGLLDINGNSNLLILNSEFYAGVGIKFVVGSN